jgi:putative methionine-R-sulfoxide reductase with GAF domain
MSRSIFRLPEAGTPPPTGERRRRIRQKLHTPVYASFNGPQTGVVVDLSELLDLSEEGFAVQTAIAAQDVGVADPVQDSEFSDATNSGSEGLSSDQETELRKSDRLEVNQHVSLFLDLPETKSFVHGTGQVIWADDTGRAGVHFAPLSSEAAHTLKQWLFSNLLIGCSNHSARQDQLARHQEAPALVNESPAHSAPEPSLAAQAAPMAAFEASPAAAISHRAELLSALDELRNQIRRITTAPIGASQNQALENQASEEAAAAETSGDRTDAVLQLIAERAVALTGATGAALALEENGEVVCRARTGNPAPLLGSHVDVSQGVSGECVRTVQPILCHDTSADRRVDPELCRALGLGSFLAVPVVSDFQVTGLFEIFSPDARAFSSDEITILQRLAELVSSARVNNRGTATQQTEEARVAVPPLASTPDAIETSIPEPPAPASSESKTFFAVPQGSKPDSKQAGSVAAETTPLEHLRAVLWDHASELEEQARQAEMHPEGAADIETSRRDTQASPASRVALEEASDDEVQDQEESADDPEAESDPDSHASSPIHHLGLLLMCLAVVALALGYLLAPVIERHLSKTAEAIQASGSSGTVQAASPSKSQPLTPEEISKLAEQGNSEAQFTLGTLYRNGDGVLQNDGKAIEWFQRAADQGHPLALRALGSAYWGGRGVEQNYSRAYFWYELALAEGDQESKSRLEGLATQMTDRQVADARQQAEAWLQAHNQPTKTALN